MPRSLIVALLIAAGSLGIFAQDDPRPPVPPDQQPGGGPLPVPPGPPDRPPPDRPGAHDPSPDSQPLPPGPPDRAPGPGPQPQPPPPGGGGGGGGGAPPPGDAEGDWDPSAPGTQPRVENDTEQRRIQELLRRIREIRPRDARSEEQAVKRLEAFPPEAFSPVLAPRKETLRITLDEAIGLALENNPDYLVALLQARSAAEGVPVAEAFFDPVLAAEAAYTEGRPPFFSANPFSGLPPGLLVASFDQFTLNASLTKRFSTGTQATLRWAERRQKTENQFSLNPSYTPSLSVELVQPLLRGFGIDVNTANLYLAENQSLQADANYAQILINAVIAVEQAYWNLVSAEEALRSQERSLTSALKFLDDQRRRREVGAAADLDVIIAQSGVAQRREGVIVAENSVEARRDELIRLVRPSDDPRKWDLFIVPLDLPWLLPERPMEVETTLSRARTRRPDRWQAELAVEASKRLLLLRENEALPQLDAFGTLTEEGLGGQHHEGWTGVGEGRFYSWTVGVRVNLPLFLRAERARARAAAIDLETSEAQLRAADANLVLEVRRTIRDVHTAKARIEAARGNRILAARRLRATRTQVEHGTAVPRDVLDDLAALAAAESNEIAAYVNYRLSLSSVERAEGTILDRWLDKLDPRVRRALDRAPYQD